ncbi:hypothetical protein GCM10009712_38400 [Pseudarthrobacter sulfonivorans]
MNTAALESMYTVYQSKYSAVVTPNHLDPGSTRNPIAIFNDAITMNKNAPAVDIARWRLNTTAVGSETAIVGRDVIALPFAGSEVSTSMCNAQCPA